MVLSRPRSNTHLIILLFQAQCSRSPLFRLYDDSPKTRIDKPNGLTLPYFVPLKASTIEPKDSTDVRSAVEHFSRLTPIQLQAGACGGSVVHKSPPAAKKRYSLRTTPVHPP